MTSSLKRPGDDQSHQSHQSHKDGIFGSIINHVKRLAGMIPQDKKAIPEGSSEAQIEPREAGEALAAAQTPRRSLPTTPSSPTNQAQSVLSKGSKAILACTDDKSPIITRTSVQNGRKLSSPQTPIERYHSPFNSLPDYGPKSSMGTQKSVKRLGFKAFNSLGTKIPPPTEKRKASVLNSPSHPMKRAKNEATTTYTSSQFAPYESAPDKSFSTSRHLSTQGSVRSHNGEDKVHTTGVAEMRSIGRFTGDQNKRGRRDRRSKGDRPSLSRGSEDSGDPIAESSDSAPRGTTIWRTGHVDKPKALDPSDHAFAQPIRKVTQATAYRRPTGNHSADDIDELSPNFISATNTTPERSPGSGPKQATQSESLSTRGDIKASLNQVGQPRKGNIEDGGVPLRGCVWLPDHTYTADGYKRPNVERCCFLRDCRGIGSDKVLQLFSDASDEAQPVLDDWFKIEAQKIHRVASNKQHYLTEVALSSNLDTGTGAKLYLEFPGEIHLTRFLEWVRKNTRVTPIGSPGDTLLDKYTHTKKLAEKHAHTKAARAAAASRPAHQEPLDIGLIQSKPASRHELRHNTNNPPSSSRDPQPVISSSQHPTTRTCNRNDGDALRDRQLGQRRSARRAPVRAMDSVTPEPEIERWSELHPEWEQKWQMPLLYQRTTVEKDDIPRLDDDQCLNDNIIGFYLRYLYTELEKHHPETARRIYFHNSFFYEKLKPAPRGAKINYEGVRNWTNKVDLFSYDYIVVPVNEHYHWWVAIICNPAKLDPDVAQKEPHSTSQSHGGADDCAPGIRGETENKETMDSNAPARQGDGEVVKDSQLEEPMVVSDVLPHDGDPAATAGDDVRGTAGPVVTLDEDGTKTATPTQSTNAPVQKAHRKPPARPPSKLVNLADPRIITLDSLGSSHGPACKHLQMYLIHEFEAKKKKLVEYGKNIGTRAVNLPEQNNFTDCGVYLLKYISKFLEDPDKFIRAILQKEKLDWDINSSKTRNDIRNLIFNLHGEYQEEQEKLKREKLTTKRRSKSRGATGAKSSVPPSSSADPASASAAPSPASETEKAYTPQACPTSPQVPKARSAMQAGGRECHTLTDQSMSSPTSVKAGHPENAKPAEGQIQASLVDADVDIRSAHDLSMSMSDSYKQRQLPVLSIEIQDDDDVSVTPVQQRHRTNLRQVSPGLDVTMDESDSKGVQFVKASPISRKRGRSGSRAEMSPDELSAKRVQSSRLSSPVLGSSPTRVGDPALGTDAVVSPYFSSVKSPGVRSTPGLKTYAARHRKTPSKEMPSVISKTPSKGNSGMTVAASPIDLTDD